MSEDRNYALHPKASEPIRPVELPDRPPIPKLPHRIGMIGCGGITESHLKAYHKAGFDVVAFSDLDEERATRRRDAFYPDAMVYPDFVTLLGESDVDVVDVATPVGPRGEIMAAAIRSGRHVLSQKPFVNDLDVGRELCDLADQHQVRLAVNQNGRWAPHLAHIREAVKAGLIGDVVSINVSIHWDHNWIAGTPFDDMDQVIIEDFAIHWFDFVASLVPGVAGDVFADVMSSPGQRAKPPLCALVHLGYPHTRATLAFDGDASRGAEDRTIVRGTRGTIRSIGPSLTEQAVTVFSAAGWYKPTLHGDWFTEGFIGTMAEFLCAIEDDREPINGARDNLRGLAMCRAAVDSARG